MIENKNMDIEEVITTEEILKMDFTTTQAINFIINGLEIAIEKGDVFEKNDTDILNKALKCFIDEHEKGKDIIIKVEK